MILKVVIAILFVAVVVLALAATRPDSFGVQRSITIRAPQQKVFALINDLRAWESWSADMDRTAQKTYSGPPSGTGAVAEWHGPGRTGAARMTITQSAAPSSLTVDVDWTRPFTAHNVNQFILRSHGDATELTWNIQASNRYPMKLIGLFVNIPREFARHMDTSLNNLQTAAEK